MSDTYRKQQVKRLLALLKPFIGKFDYIGIPYHTGMLESRDAGIFEPTEVVFISYTALLNSLMETAGIDDPEFACRVAHAQMIVALCYTLYGGEAYTITTLKDFLKEIPERHRFLYV